MTEIPHFCHKKGGRLKLATFSQSGGFITKLSCDENAFPVPPFLLRSDLRLQAHSGGDDGFAHAGNIRPTGGGQGGGLVRPAVCGQGAAGGGSSEWRRESWPTDGANVSVFESDRRSVGEGEGGDGGPASGHGSASQRLLAKPGAAPGKNAGAPPKHGRPAIDCSDPGAKG